MQHFKNAHRNMLFGQFLPNKLTDLRALHAFKEVWREEFIQEPVKALSYSDQAIPLTKTRSALSALSFMRLLQAAKISKKEHVLHIAAGTGYGSVVLSYLAKNVVALEEDKDLTKQMLQNIEASSARNIETDEGKLSEGASKKGPYDVIFVEGAAENIPFVLLDQLKNGGRLLVFEPLMKAPNGHLSRACHYQKIEKTYTKTYLFEAGAPLLPAFAAFPKFQL